MQAKAFKYTRRLRPGEKRFTVIMLPGAGFEYRFEGELFTGKDIRNIYTLARLGYRLHKRSLTKQTKIKENKDDSKGERRSGSSDKS